MQLLLLHYNNYFNRIIKKENTIAAYKAADADYKEASNLPLDTVILLGFVLVSSKLSVQLAIASMHAAKPQKYIFIFFIINLLC